MSAAHTGLARLPVNGKGVRQRLLVRTELVHLEAQLQNFTPLRDRLVAAGQDANATYREIQARRDHLLAELRKLAPPRTSPSVLPVPYPIVPVIPPLPVFISPIRWMGPPLGPWFGYGGSVQMGPAQEGDNVIPPGVSGSLDTLDSGLLQNGSICFSGDLVSAGNPATWLHNWNYLLVFPAPVVTSVFTYSFAVGVQVNMVGLQGSATFMSFATLGETASFTGQEIAVDTDGFPYMTNFTSPANRGVLNVQGSFLVEAGHLPAVALVLSISTSLSPQSEIVFSNIYDCFMCPAATIDPATATGPLAQRGIVNFHYEPLPPQSLQ